MALGSGAIEGGRDGYRLGREPAFEVDLDDAARLVAESQRRLAAGAPALAATAATAALDVLGTPECWSANPTGRWVRRARARGDHAAARARQAAAAARRRASTGDHGRTHAPRPRPRPRTTRSTRPRTGC